MRQLIDLLEDKDLQKRCSAAKCFNCLAHNSNVASMMQADPRAAKQLMLLMHERDETVKALGATSLFHLTVNAAPAVFKNLRSLGLYETVADTIAHAYRTPEFAAIARAMSIRVLLVGSQMDKKLIKTIAATEIIRTLMRELQPDADVEFLDMALPFVCLCASKVKLTAYSEDGFRANLTALKEHVKPELRSLAETLDRAYAAAEANSYFHLVVDVKQIAKHRAGIKHSKQSELRTCSNESCVNRQIRPREYALCSRCLSVAYCSESCQVEHWTNGHSVACVSHGGFGQRLETVKDDEAEKKSAADKAKEDDAAAAAAAAAEKEKEKEKEKAPIPAAPVKRTEKGVEQRSLNKKKALPSKGKGKVKGKAAPSAAAGTSKGKGKATPPPKLPVTKTEVGKQAPALKSKRALPTKGKGKVAAKGKGKAPPLKPVPKKIAPPKPPPKT